MCEFERVPITESVPLPYKGVFDASKVIVKSCVGESEEANVTVGGSDALGVREVVIVVVGGALGLVEGV